MLGEVIGNFKLVASLGRGGAGEVFLGEHTGIQTKVAIKVLHSEISSDTAQVQRFFNEARIVGKIKHAGIAKIFDVGFAGNSAYLVMELLEGESLRDRLVRGTLPISDVVELGRQIASVLDSTHRAGITHRDLKPDNIFLVADDDLDGRDRAKVLDFGIAKLSGALANTATPRTQGTIGTPTYMAPEQWSDSSKVSWAVDAYSLGCVMFEMACGRPPFVAATIAEACAKHLTEPPPLASSLRADLPARLDQLIARLLSKTPEQRGDSMAAIASELGSIAGRSRASVDNYVPEPHPVAVAQTTLDERSGRRGSRTKIAMLGSVVAILVVVVVVIVVGQGNANTASATKPSAPVPVAPNVARAPATPSPAPSTITPPPDAMPAIASGSASPASTPSATTHKRTKAPKPVPPPTTPPKSDKPGFVDLDGDGIPDQR